MIPGLYRNRIDKGNWLAISQAGRGWFVGVTYSMEDGYHHLKNTDESGWIVAEGLGKDFMYVLPAVLLIPEVA